MSDPTEGHQPDNNPTLPEQKTNTSGGAATAGGVAFQANIAAWAAVRILAQEMLDDWWDLGNVHYTSLHCEAPQPVDDLIIHTSNGGNIFIQAKNSINRSEKPNSEFAKTIQQFVHQYQKGKPSPVGAERVPLDVTKDRLVLIGGPGMAGTLSTKMARVLHTLRDSIGTETNLNKEEQEDVDLLKTYINTFWDDAITGSPPSDLDHRTLLKLMWITQMDFDVQRHQKTRTIDDIKRYLVQDPATAAVCWTTLKDKVITLASEQGSVDHAALMELLVKAGIPLKVPPSYQSDTEKLMETTSNTRTILGKHSFMVFKGKQLSIQRDLSEKLYVEALNGPLLVVGVPGAGKSSTLATFMDFLQEKRNPVVFLRATDLISLTTSEQERQRLKHPLVDVLQAWPMDRKGFLIIDALDAVRSEDSAFILYSTLEALLVNPGRWTVVLSVRWYEARYSTPLKNLLAGKAQLTEEYQFQDLSGLRHLKVPELTTDELQQVAEQVPEFNFLLQDQPATLSHLLRIPFNLSLALKLLEVQSGQALLSSTRNEIELLNHYWNLQIKSERDWPQFRSTLKKLLQAITERSALQVPEPDSFVKEDRDAVQELQRLGILTEKRSSVASGESDTLSFFHHILYDYAAAQYHLGDQWISKLAEKPELMLLLRPSINMKLQLLWDADETHQSFWDMALKLVAQQHVPVLGHLAAAYTVANNVHELEDFAPWETAFHEPEQQKAAVRLLSLVVSEFQAFFGNDERTTSRVSIFAALMTRLMEFPFRDDLTVHYLNEGLMYILSHYPAKLDTDTKRKLAHTAQDYFQEEFQRNTQERDLFRSVQALVSSLEVAPEANLQCLLRLLEPEVMEVSLRPLGRVCAVPIGQLFELNPGFALSLYGAVFSIQLEDDQLRVLGRKSNVQTMVTSTSEDLGTCQLNLSEGYKAFSISNHVEATRLLKHTLSVHATSSMKPQSGPHLVELMGHTTGWIDDGHGTDWTGVIPGDAHHALTQMVQHWIHALARLGNENPPLLLEVWDQNLEGPMTLWMWNCWFQLASRIHALGDHLKSILWSPMLLSGLGGQPGTTAWLEQQYLRSSNTEQQQIDAALESLGTSRADYTSGVWWGNRLNLDVTLLADNGPLQEPAPDSSPKGAVEPTWTVDFENAYNSALEHLIALQQKGAIQDPCWFEAWRAFLDVFQTADLTHTPPRTLETRWAHFLNVTVILFRRPGFESAASHETLDALLQLCTEHIRFTQNTGDESINPVQPRTRLVEQARVLMQVLNGVPTALQMLFQLLVRDPSMEVRRQAYRHLSALPTWEPEFTREIISASLEEDPEEQALKFLVHQVLENLPETLAESIPLWLRQTQLRARELEMTDLAYWCVHSLTKRYLSDGQHLEWCMEAVSGNTLHASEAKALIQTTSESFKEAINTPAAVKGIRFTRGFKACKGALDHLQRFVLAVENQTADEESRSEIGKRLGDVLLIATASMVTNLRPPDTLGKVLPKGSKTGYPQVFDAIYPVLDHPCFTRWASTTSDVRTHAKP